MNSPHFFKGLSWLILLNVLIKPVWIFAIDRSVQNAVGYAAYGTYFAILNLSIVVSFMADAGITNMMNRQMAISGHHTPFNVKSLLRIKFFLLLLYGSVVFFISWITGITRWDIVLPVVAVQILTSLFLFFRNIITAHQLFSTDAWLSVLDKLLMIMICGIFIYRPFIWSAISLPLFLHSQLLCTAIAVCVASVIIYKKELIPAGAIQVTGKELIATTTPFVLIILLMSAHSRLDAFLLDRLYHYGAAEAGIYASAYRLLDACNMVGYLAASFLVPFIARNKNNFVLLQTTINPIRHALLLCAAVATAFTIAFASNLQQWLYHNQYAYNILILQLCIAVLPAYYIIHIYSSLLTALGQFRLLIYTVLLCVVLNVVLNIEWIPAYGAAACCVAALISQYACAALVYILASKKNNFSLSLSSYLWYFFVAVASLLAFFFVKQFL